MFRFADALTVYAHATDDDRRWLVAYMTDTGIAGQLPVALAEATPTERGLVELMALRHLLVDLGLAGIGRSGPKLTVTVSEPAIMALASGHGEGSPLRPFATFLRTRLLGASWQHGTDVLPLTGALQPALTITHPLPVLETTSFGPIELTHHAVVQYHQRVPSGDLEHAYRLLRRQVMRHALILVPRSLAQEALATVRHGEEAECLRLRDGVFLVCVKAKHGDYRVAVTCYVRPGS